jgi:hypothetical protein
MNIFISHSAADNDLAEELRAALKKHAALVKDDIKVWSEEQLLPGDNWALKSGKALQNADAFVVLLSPHSINSDSVRREIDFALSEPQFRDRLIPVVVKPTDEIPWILRKQQLIHATKDIGKIARQIADALRKQRAAV